ncbi:MAG TPA: hypothetical protein VMQ62_02285 [Dongiaceae bacterium]|nr:hypothetical protein [Dongiaceae bacterium]
MRRLAIGTAVLGAAMLQAGSTASFADNLAGVNQLLCTAVQATGCHDDGECTSDLPWNLNVPQFIQIDLTAKRLQTTKASGENRSTPIEFLKRDGGLIVLQGFERGRAFSFVIEEDTGMASVAVAAPGRAVVVFGACTPMPEGMAR